MVKMVGVVKKKAGMSDEEFRRYWIETHGPVAARIPGLRRLVISPAVRAWRGEPFDGIVELWFDDMEALEEAFSSTEAEKGREDISNFIERSSMFVTEEKTIVEGMA